VRQLDDITRQCRHGGSGLSRQAVNLESGGNAGAVGRRSDCSKGSAEEAVEWSKRPSAIEPDQDHLRDLFTTGIMTAVLCMCLPWCGRLSWPLAAIRGLERACRTFQT
jgi:hypothetical protein